ncbi:MAG: hypothetical protein M3Z16_09805 [Pseudomonadota bacterium]|nr:hypothetical protein [Pseudomonadota bacterium]
MEFNVTKEQWIDRFVIHYSTLSPGLEPGDVIGKGAALWASHGQLEPEAVAVSQFAQRSRHGGFDDPFEATLGVNGGQNFERTERIPVERVHAPGAYVRDDGEWIARCVARVLQLDPIIKADEARRSVGDLVTLERWRLMSPEAAAEQLYTPIKLRRD